MCQEVTLLSDLRVNLVVGLSVSWAKQADVRGDIETRNVPTSYAARPSNTRELPQNAFLKTLPVRPVMQRQALNRPASAIASVQIQRHPSKLLSKIKEPRDLPAFIYPVGSTDVHARCM